MADGTARLSVTGDWWLPANPEHKIHGTLAINHDGRASLSTSDAVTPAWYGDLVQQVPPDGGELSEYMVTVPAIHGESQVEEYGLLDCDLLVEPAGHVTLEIDVGAVVEGALVAGDDDAAFLELHLGVENLAAFAVATTLRAGEPNALLIREQVGPVMAQAGDLTVSIVWRPRRAREVTRVGRTLAFGEVVVFEVRSSNPLSIRDWRKVGRQLQDFVTYASGTSSATTFWNLVVPAAEYNTERGGQPVRARLIEPVFVSPQADPLCQGRVGHAVGREI